MGIDGKQIRKTQNSEKFQKPEGELPMPSTARDNEFNLFHQLKIARIDPDAVQRFFDENQIRINVHTHEGLDRVIRMGGDRSTLPDSAETDYLFGNDDMTDMHNGFNRKQYAVHYFVSALSGGYHNAKMLVFREGERYPRQISYDREEKRLSLSEPIDRALPKPTYPGWGKALLNRLFGAYKTEFEDYAKEKKRYDDRMAYFRDPDVYRKAARFAENEARRRSWQDENQKRFENQIDEEKKIAEHHRILCANVGKNLDARFSAGEDLGRGPSGNSSFDRLDNVMIDGQTVRSLIISECLDKARKETKRSAFDIGMNAYKAMDRDALMERMNRLVTDAQLTGKKVTCLFSDEKTGKLIPTENGETVHTLDTLDALKAMERDNPEMHRKIKNSALAAETGERKDTAEILRQTEETKSALERVNYFSRLEEMNPSGSIMRNALFGRTAGAKNMTVKDFLDSLPVKNGLSVSRSCLQSHAIGYLAMEGMSIEDICDPTKELKKKADAAEKVLQCYNADDYAFLAKVNLEGSEKLRDKLDAQFAKTDFSDDKSLLSEQNLPYFAMVNAVFDMQQERDKYADACYSYIAGKKGLDITDPEQKQECTQIYDKFSDSTMRLSMISKVLDGSGSAAHLAAGSLSNFATDVRNILVGEFFRSAYDRGNAEKKPASDVLPISDIGMLLGSVELLKATEAERFPKGDGPIRQFTSIRDAGQLASFGRYAMTGVLRKSFRFGLDNQEDGLHVSLEKTALSAAAPKAPAAERTVASQPVQKNI